MRFACSTLVALLGFSHLAIGDSIDRVFNVKEGTIKGGCDNYRNGGDMGTKLEEYFAEAMEIINIVSPAIDNYSKDFQVQKVAKSFFGITPNDRLDGTRSDGDQKVLEHVQEWFRELKRFVNGEWDEKLPLFCDGTWLEVTTKVYKADGIEQPNLEVKDDKAYGEEIPQLKTGEVLLKPNPPRMVNAYSSIALTYLAPKYVAYWSSDLREYYFGPLYNTNPPNYCAIPGHLAVTTATVTSTERSTISLTLCPMGFFSKRGGEEKIKTSMQKIGAKLQKSNSKSLTLIHEMVHIIGTPAETVDQLAWRPPPTVRKKIGNKANPAWPGNTDDFIQKQDEAYNAADALLLAQKTPREPTENNPENYAWAAVAIYLAKEGDMRDYSTLLARDPLEPFAGPYPLHRRDINVSRDQSYVVRNFTA
ncbi:hypothetical protein FQN49_000248 [Arthroderma sp. PD_2]|nr:hypothetical protein FQN49_000248 [Arthroderma sp. PD_2]